MSRTLAHVEPKVLRWARESAGYALDQAAAAHRGVSAEKLERAERGETLLTLRQAERIAEVYGRPLSLLFAPAPPDEPAPERQLRRLPDAPGLPWPPEMHRLSRVVAERQDAAELLYEELEELPPWKLVQTPIPGDPDDTASRLRELLGITALQQRSWRRDPRGYAGLSAWRDAVEALGVLVMQDGSMPLDTMRGFAALHPRVPAIVLNTDDDPRARCYTLLHELGHLLRDRVGHSARDADEGWCDRLAGATLMPETAFRHEFRRLSERHDELLPLLGDLALSFGVTPAAAAVRSSIYGLAPHSELTRARAEIARRDPGPRPKGGEHYRNQIARLGPAFARLVLEARGADAISSGGAAKLLRTKVDKLPKLEAVLYGRAGGE